MQDVWALHPAMPNASNYFSEHLTQVQKLRIWMGCLYEAAMWKQRHDDVCGLVEFPITCAKWLVLCPPDPGAPLCAWWKTKQETSTHSSRIWRWCDVVFRVAVSVWFHTELILCERDYFERPRSSGRRRSPPHGHTQIGMGEAVRGGTGLGRPRGHAPRRLHAHLALGSPSEKRAWRRWCLPRRTAATKRN